MYASKTTLLALTLPFALLGACGGDDTEDTGADTSANTDSPTTAEPTTDEPTTAEPTTAEPTTGEPTTGEPTTTGDPDTTGEPVAEAEIRVFHLGVGAPGVDVFANGAEPPAFSGLEFRNGTDYAALPAGDYTFDVSVAGTPVEEAVISVGPLALEAETSYTAVAIGDIDETGETGLQVIAIVDDAAGIDPADVRITVVHAAPAVGEVDIWEISGEPIPLLENVPFGESAGLGDIAAGPLEIGVDVDDDANPDVTFSVDASGLGGQQVNVYANNDQDGNVALVAQVGAGPALVIPAN